jgi:60 kDa SS-A/Ro ribonucleoprotein
MNTALTSYSTRKTPQSEPIAGAGQVPNSAGGYGWEASDWTRLTRFLVLGSDGGSYYASQKKLTLENIAALEACLAADGLRTVAEIVAISEAGRAPKNDYAIFALALCLAKGDPATRRAAGVALPRVCRTATHLMQFATFSENLRGWGRGLRRAVASWYEQKDVDQLAYQVVKYRTRQGFSHRDLLRLAHPKATAEESRPARDQLYRDMESSFQARDWQSFESQLAERDSLPDTAQAAKADVYDWICGRATDLARLPRVVQGYEAAKGATPEAAARLVREYGLTHEMLPSEALAHAEVWAALLERMPVGALVRNLGRMTANGLLTSQSAASKLVVEKLEDAEAIVKARLHPLAVLAALKTYEQGHGMRGSLTWSPVTKVVDALDGAFYSAFGAVEPTGKRLMLAIDISGSMEWDFIHNIPGLTPRVAAGALALVTANVESDYLVTVFSSGDAGISEVTLSPRQRLDDALQKIAAFPAGGTDCALPMLYAAKRNLEVDTFVIFTDNETWAGNPHPSQALEGYRQQTGIPARMAVCAMVSNGFSIADPRDPGQLDVVGFDTATPEMLSYFARGRI